MLNCPITKVIFSSTQQVTRKHRQEKGWNKRVTTTISQRYSGPDLFYVVCLVKEIVLVYRHNIWPLIACLNYAENLDMLTSQTCLASTTAASYFSTRMELACLCSKHFKCKETKHHHRSILSCHTWSTIYGLLKQLAKYWFNPMNKGLNWYHCKIWPSF